MIYFLNDYILLIMLLYLQKLKFKVNGELKNVNVSTPNSAA